MKFLQSPLPMVWCFLRSIHPALTAFQSRIGRYYLKLWGVQVGKHLTMSSFPYCRTIGSGKIIIGNNVMIKNKLKENPAGVFHRCVLLADSGATLSIADNVGISGSIIYATKSVTIGDGCMLGANCQIFTSDFHPLNAKDRRERNREATVSGPVILEKDVWVGANAVILRNITIGRGSVVAVGSIVTKDVPAGVIVAGNPARVISAVPERRLEA